MRRLPAVVPAFLLAIALGVAVAACGGSADVPASVAPAPSGLESPVEGVPIDIDAEGFTKVLAFTLRMDDGAQVLFRMGTIENAAQFPPNHLAEHLAGSTRIRVFFRRDGSDLVAYRLEDVTP